MKVQTYSHHCLYCTLAWALLCLIACVNHIAGDEDDASHQQDLCVQARSAEKLQLEYPVHIYAFVDDGSCIATQTIASQADKPRLALPEGSYRLVALAGTEGYNLPQPMTLKGNITIKGGHFATTALMMGHADIVLANSNQTLNITLSYSVAKVSLALTQVPAEVTQADISLSPLSTTLNMSGERGTETGVLTATCTATATGEWSTPHLYTFGGSGQNTVCSIALSSGNATTTYGYTYQQTLQVGTPYIMQGSFKGGNYTIEGSLSMAGWKDPVSVDFGFGGEASSNPDADNPDTDNPDADNPDTDETIAVAQIPQPGTLWNGHLVALTTVTNIAATRADLLLLSLEEWTNIPAANNAEGDNNRAATLVAAYSEAGMTGWRIPTGEEAKKLKQTYGNQYNETCLDAINSMLTTAGGDALTHIGKDANGDDVRYLCTNATQAFAFSKPAGQNTTTQGTTRTYYLRAVRTQSVVKQ